MTIKKPFFNRELFTEKSSVWIFTIILIVFISLKIPHIQLPFFWDEAGVYGNMIFHLADNELSLHPKAINEWISRGHPLLYPNLIAAVCKIFGTSTTVAHSTNFLLACLLLVSIYYTISKLVNPWVGLISSTLLAFQPLFFAQSVFVLPEIALALFLWWTTWFFIKRNYILYFIFGSAAVMIKEPAIVWIGSLFIWDLFFSEKKFSIKTILWISPLITFGLFLVIQKMTFGWYFFPYHTGGFDYNPMHVIDKMWDYLFYCFRKEGRILWFLILMLSAIAYLFKGYLRTFSYPLLNKRYFSWLFASAIYLIFSSSTFYHQRYLIAIFPVISAIVAILSFYMVFQKKPVLALIFVLIATLISYQYRSSKTFNYDLDMSYIRSIESTKSTIQYIMESGMMEQGEFSATMPILYVTEDPRFGYMPKGVTGRKSKIVDENTKYVVQVTPGTPIENPDNFPLEVIDNWYDHDIKTIIYRVVQDTTHLDK